jgi:CPA1 family monovalent cation:H+ antiporter
VRAWHIVAAIAVGVAVGILDPGRFSYALGHATLYLFLPPLLFEAAWNLSYRAIVRQWAAIATLAGPGVVLTALVVAGALAAVGTPFGPALLTGAILSATDPISVIAVFRRLKVPRTLATIVECESLFNDAVAVVLYRAVLTVLAVGAASASGVARVTLLSIGSAAGGVLFGVAVAFVAARMLRGSTRALAQIAATVVCAYGAYFAADVMNLSGIFAVVACGIGLRFFERRSIALSIAADVNRFWDLAALAANVLVFFLVGAALQIGQVTREPVFIAACLIAVALSRVLVAGLLLPGGYPRQWLAVVHSAGMRGALSLALSIALPLWVPYRSAIIDAAFAVVLATLIVSALTTERVVRRASLERS